MNLTYGPIQSHNWPHNTTAGHACLFADVRPSAGGVTTACGRLEKATRNKFLADAAKTPGPYEC